MKIDRIDITNVLGVRRVNIDTTSPITLICGKNGTGKSSMQECVRMAILGDVLRVEKKKDYPLMVTDGAKEGSATVYTDSKYENSVALPKGIFNSAEYGYPTEIIASVLNAHRFAEQTEDERRAFLFRLTGCEASPERITPMLVDRKCDKARIEAAIPMLRAGFVEANRSAAAKATEAKGAWRVITGETYGSVKAQGWKAPVPEVDQEAIAASRQRVDELNGKMLALQNDIATREGTAAEQRKNAAKLEQAKVEAAKLKRATEKLTFDETNYAAAKKSLEAAQMRAGTERHEGLVHDMARFIPTVGYPAGASEEADALMERYRAEFGEPDAAGDDSARASLPALQNAVALLARSVENDRRDIATAQAAANILVEFGTIDMIDESATEKMRAQIKDVITERDAASKALDVLQLAALAANNADTMTAKAAIYHADVEEWSKIAAALAADGIPSELLAQALKPINSHLRESAAATGWMQVAIGPDMSIRADNRLYQLLSESEKWRCDAMIAETIAQLADIRTLMLDRVDVLDLPSRGTLLTWLDGQVEAGGLESVLLFGTFKKLPTGLPDTISAHWIADGYIPQAHDQLAA